MQEKTDKELYKEFLLGNNKSFEEIKESVNRQLVKVILKYFAKLN